MKHPEYDVQTCLIKFAVHVVYSPYYETDCAVCQTALAPNFLCV